MSLVHQTIERAMWFAPKPAINDDDIYIVQYEGKRGWKIVSNLGCSSATAACARSGAQSVHVGQALFKGMTLKNLLLKGEA
jgi:hypothetical protein